MLRTVIVFAFGSSLAVGTAPVPPPSEKALIAKYWGTTAGQGEFSLTGKRLTLRSAGRSARGPHFYGGPRQAEGR
jgi:hypothetical protein